MTADDGAIHPGESEQPQLQASVGLRPREEWPWDVCAVCGSEEVTNRALFVMVSGRGDFYTGRMGWCAKLECQHDRIDSGTISTPFTTDDAARFDEAYA